VNKRFVGVNKNIKFARFNQVSEGVSF